MVSFSTGELDRQGAIVDTTTCRKLESSEYNRRREQRHRVATYFALPALRDLSPERLMAGFVQLDRTAGKRALHEVSENARVLSTVKHLKESDMTEVGQ